jgi:hypothetical protein
VEVEVASFAARALGEVLRVQRQVGTGKLRADRVHVEAARAARVVHAVNAKEARSVEPWK